MQPEEHTAARRATVPCTGSGVELETRHPGYAVTRRDWRCRSGVWPGTPLQSDRWKPRTSGQPRVTVAEQDPVHGAVRMHVPV